MTVEEVVQWIVTQASSEDISRIWGATQDRKGILDQMAKATFKVGDYVKLTGSKKVARRGDVDRGQITRINRTKILVHCENTDYNPTLQAFVGGQTAFTDWNCPPGMLVAMTEQEKADYLLAVAERDAKSEADKQRRNEIAQQGKAS